MQEVDFAMEEVGRLGQRFGMFANMFAIASLMPAWSGQQYTHSPFLVSVGR